VNTKKLISFLLPIFLLGLTTFAQPVNGSTSPDWTMRDIKGNVWHLYDLTAKGKTVYLDISATWCGPCWHYHKTGYLDSLYKQHGPTGSVDQSCYVFFIEGDSRTTYADLNGTGTRTAGNWLADTDIPIFNPGEDTISPVMLDYNIQYYPTILMICPDNKVFLMGPISDDMLFEKSKSGCPAITNKKVKTDKKNFNAEAGNNFKDEIFTSRFFVTRKRISIGRKSSI
jgi:hypothetical protein